MKNSPKFETLVVHAGLDPDPSTGAVVTPIYQTSTYVQDQISKHKGFEYARTQNPTRSALEKALALLEAGTSAYAFGSGMAAIDAVLKLLKPGDHVLAVNDLYGGTFRMFDKIYKQYGISFSYTPATDTAIFLEQIQENTTLVWLESPTNPHLSLCDITEIAENTKIRSSTPLIAVDNTFATPYLQQPLLLGADIVVHSTTKYIGGHSDLIGGAVVIQDSDLAEQFGFIQNAVGAVPGPLDCFLSLRGLRTLALRMTRHAENALVIAKYLQERPEVEQVYYPFLRSHPQFSLAHKQMKNGGGMISFTLKGGRESAKSFAESTKVFLLAESLGGVESLVEVPALMTHASTAQSALEVDSALVRLSVGIENIDDLLEDIDQAF
ncbi:MAG: cystathionine gamma-synthase [Anaerolineales bacterium]|nr:cystathionine gamma-synthase [Anaerolineales bacterium]